MDESGRTSIPYYDVDWTATPSALVIGNEGNGLSDEVRNAVADGTIQATHVPMEAGIESLNAAVCGSVIMFEFLRQCRTKSWHFSQHFWLLALTQHNGRKVGLSTAFYSFYVNAELVA
jgi:tRNA C32,U32 (ribose-2'-O)-methylase TrmJ